jgi:hypothetical protein
MKNSRSVMLYILTGIMVITILTSSIPMSTPLLADEGSSRNSESNQLALSLNVTPELAHNGDTVQYQMSVNNTADTAPSVTNGDVVDIVVSFYPPGLDGLPVSEPTYVSTPFSIAAGSDTIYLPEQSVLLNLNTGVTEAQGKATFIGMLITNPVSQVSCEKIILLTLIDPAVCDGIDPSDNFITYPDNPQQLVQTTTITSSDGIEWSRQFGSNNYDTAEGVAVDSNGSVLVVGFTDGVLPGQTASGSGDAFIRKYDSAGNELWTRQFGSSSDDSAEGVAVDSSGSALVVGYTYGALPGQTASYTGDNFIRKYDSAGNELWTRQFGSYGAEYAYGVAVDGNGCALVVGYTESALPGQTASGPYDAFIRKYDGAGNELWTRQFGSSSGVDIADGVAVDGNGCALVVGDASGTLPGQTSSGSCDAFIRKYDGEGNELWTRQFGSNSADWADGVAVDSSGSALVVGYTDSALPGQTSSGSCDTFIRKYDGAGNELWTRQFGSNGADWADGVAVDASGSALVVGHTDSALPGQTSSGLWDAFIRKYDNAGNVVWTRQFGSNSGDLVYGVAVDSSGSALVVGNTDGALPGQTSNGGKDAFIVNYENPPGLLRIQTFPAVPTLIYLDGIPRNNWGLNWVKMPAGEYTLSFSDVDHYNVPATVTVNYYPGTTGNVQSLNDPINVYADTVTEVIVNFEQLGNLRVETSPPLPATIYCNGKPMDDWGFWANIEPGEYTISFEELDGYITPQQQTVTVSSGYETTHVVGEYVAGSNPVVTPPHGLLRVQTDPAVPTRIYLNGIPCNNWGLNWVKLPAGDYSLALSDVDYYDTPSSVTVNYYPGDKGVSQALSEPIHIYENVVTEVVVNFVQLGNLMVETSPPLPATIYCNGYPIDDWGFWANIEAGVYTISFQDMEGYLTPPAIDVSVNQDQGTHVVGNYTDGTTQVVP